MGPEAKLRTEVIVWAKDRGCMVGRFYELGFPDRVFVLPNGKVAFIEFKAKDKKPTTTQYRKLNNLSDLGHHAAWFDSAECAISYLKGLMI